MLAMGFACMVRKEEEGRWAEIYVFAFTIVCSWEEEGRSGNRLGGFEDLQGSTQLIGRQHFPPIPRENITSRLLRETYLIRTRQLE